MSSRKGFGVEIDMGSLGLGSIMVFVMSVGIPLALAAYVFYGQIITMDLVADLRDDPRFKHKSGQEELTKIYASNIIVLVLAGCMMLSGIYVLGSGLVAITSGSVGVHVK